MRSQAATVRFFPYHKTLYGVVVAAAGAAAGATTEIGVTGIVTDCTMPLILLAMTVTLFKVCDVLLPGAAALTSASTTGNAESAT